MLDVADAHHQILGMVLPRGELERVGDEVDPLDARHVGEHVDQLVLVDVHLAKHGDDFALHAGVDERTEPRLLDGLHHTLHVRLRRADLHDNDHCSPPRPRGPAHRPYPARPYPCSLPGPATRTDSVPCGREGGDGRHFFRRARFRIMRVQHAASPPTRSQAALICLSHVCCQPLNPVVAPIDVIVYSDALVLMVIQSHMSSICTDAKRAFHLSEAV